MKERKEKFVELDILRVFAILLVVFGHCTYISFQEPANGTIALKDTPMLHEPIFNFAAIICGWIYTFHMPLFFALSGMCYALNEHTEYTIGKFVWKKFKRLLIPFFLVGSLYMIPVKYIAKYFPDIFLAEKVFLSLEMYGHLWFLIVLFEIFIIFRILRKYCSSITPLVIISLFLYCVGIPNFYSLMGKIAPALTYLIWFVLGYILYRERDIFQRYLKSNLSYMLFFISFAVSWIDWRLGFLSLFCKTLVGCVAAYMFAICLAKTKISNYSSFSTLLKYSFSIYLFHDPLNYVIIHAFSKWHWIETFPALAATTFIGLRTIGICLLSIFIAYAVEKLKLYFTNKIMEKFLLRQWQ